MLGPILYVSARVDVSHTNTYLIEQYSYVHLIDGIEHDQQSDRQQPTADHSIR